MLNGLTQIGLVMLVIAIPTTLPGEQTSRATQSERPGVKPIDARNCPASHPIKGNFTTNSGERCIYHMPKQRFYEKTKPERCYATEEESKINGCRASKVWDWGGKRFVFIKTVQSLFLFFLESPIWLTCHAVASLWNYKTFSDSPRRGFDIQLRHVLCLGL